MIFGQLARYEYAQTRQNCLFVVCLFIIQPLLLSSKVMVHLWKSQPASTVYCLNCNTKCSVLSQHNNKLALNGYYCLFQAQGSGFKTWLRYNVSPGAPFFCGSIGPLPSEAINRYWHSVFAQVWKIRKMLIFTMVWTEMTTIGNDHIKQHEQDVQYYQLQYLGSDSRISVDFNKVFILLY